MKSKLILISIILLAIFLRFYKLGVNPPSLYWDEASLGYNGWSMSQDLRDEHGDFFPITNFKAFGDYKPPVYIYLTTMTTKFLGLNEFAVRFPSAFFGVISVICSYLIVMYLLKIFLVGNAYVRFLPLLSSFFLAISPWAINLSRVAFEANVSSSLFLIGLVVFLHVIFTEKIRLHIKIIQSLLMSMFFVLPLYTFNSSRIFIPIFALILLIFFHKQIIKNIKLFVLCSLFFVLILAPLVPHLMSKEGRLRFNEVNIFTNPVPVEISNARIKEDGNSFWSKIINNRRVYYFEDYLKHLTDNFKGDFLFLTGDVNATFSTRRNGELYAFDLILILLGIYFLWFRSKKLCFFFLSWLLVGIIPSGVARETPHALRSMNLLPVYQILSVFGVYFLIIKIRRIRHIALICLMIFIVVNFYFYLNVYYNFYPKEQSKYFEYGYKELVTFVSQNQNKYDKIYVSSVRGRPYIYFLFYRQIRESDYLKNSDVKEDFFGFYNVSRFENIYFTYSTFLGTSRTLTVGAPEEFGNAKNFNIIKKIKFLDGTDDFWIVKN